MTHFELVQNIIAISGLAVITAGLLVLKSQLHSWGKVCRIREYV